MKLLQIAEAIKTSDGSKLNHLPTPQIARILAQGMREIRSAIEGAGEAVVVVPGLGRFRSQEVTPKAGADGETPAARRVTKFVAAKERAVAVEEEEAAAVAAD